MRERITRAVLVLFQSTGEAVCLPASRLPNLLPSAAPRDALPPVGSGRKHNRAGLRRSGYAIRSFTLGEANASHTWIETRSPEINVRGGEQRAAAMTPGVATNWATITR